MVTYGDIARKWQLSQVSEDVCTGSRRCCGHNPISIIIPCHRVVGTNGSLTGYAGGIDVKIKLLTLEGADMKRLFIPKKGTAL
ncbi:MAG: methylated-DNA--[protein]-cysteine S-methyltransferase [Agathobacter rectalis]